MASTTHYSPFALPTLLRSSSSSRICSPKRPYPLLLSSVINCRAYPNTLIFELQGWYNKDDVVAEWKEVNGCMCLHVHCYVTGPNLFLDLAAEFRYHIFSKELPLVLQAVLHGDSTLFREHPDLVDSIVWVYFHSSSAKYNRMECWGPLKEASQRQQGDQIHDMLLTDGQVMNREKWGNQKSFFQGLRILGYNTTRDNSTQHERQQEHCQEWAPPLSPPPPSVLGPQY